MIDCRDHPSVNNCTVAITADTDDEVMEAAVAHAVKSHEHTDTPELRSQIRQGIKETATT
jgi:predicted small metal-binding protein